MKLSTHNLPRPTCEKLALHRVARTCPRREKVVVRDIAVAESMLELTERSEVERIFREAIDIRYRRNLGKPALRSIALCYGYRAIERDDRRRTNRHQCIVQGDDHRPVGVLQGTRARVQRRDPRFDVKLRDRRTGGRMIEQPLALRNELRVPERTILLVERAQISTSIHARREPSGVEAHERDQRVRGWRRRLWTCEQQLGEPHRLDAQLPAHRRRRVRAVIALAEQQVERPLHGGESSRQVALVGEIEESYRAREHLLPARYPLLHCR